MQHLDRQGFPIFRDGQLHAAMKLKGEDYGRIFEWIKRKQINIPA